MGLLVKFWEKERKRKSGEGGVFVVVSGWAEYKEGRVKGWEWGFQGKDCPLVYFSF